MLPPLPGLENINKKSSFNIPDDFNFTPIMGSSTSTPSFLPQGQSGLMTDFPKLAVDIIHGITRSGAAIGLDLSNTPEIPQAPKGTVERMVKDIIYGPDIVKSLSTRIAEGEQTARGLGIPTTAPLGINPALLVSSLAVGGTVALDFTGVGGEKKLGEKLLAETSPEIISKLLTKIKVSEDLISKYSKLFAKATTPEEVSSGLKSMITESSKASKIAPLAPKIAPEMGQYDWKTLEAQGKLFKGTSNELTHNGRIAYLKGIIDRNPIDIKEIKYITGESSWPKKGMQGMTREEWQKALDVADNVYIVDESKGTFGLGQTQKTPLKLFEGKFSDFQKPPTPTISPELQPLAQEARKYKSAEEFVKAQPKLYHSGTADIKEVNFGKTNFNKTFYLSDNADYAKSFGGKNSVINEMTLDPKANIIDLRKPTYEQIQSIKNGIDTLKAKPAKYGESFSFYPYDEKTVLQGIQDGKAHFAELPQIKEVLKNLGYDGQITAEVPYAKNIGIWNKDVIKTKSQLTDFYNKAVGETKPVSELTSKEAELVSQTKTQSTKQMGQELPPQLPIKEIPSKIESLPPTIPSIGEEVKGAIDRLTEAIKTSAKPARKELEKAYQAERAKRTGALAGIFEKGAGQKGYFQALGKLKGELAPKSFEGLNLVEKDVNSLFKAAQINPALDIYEKLNTQTALTKILTGTIPTDSELSLLEKTFGNKVVEAILSQRSLGQKILDGLGQVANLPRSIMASFDLSAPFRQGLALISHPKAFGNAFISMFKQFGSEKAFKAVQESIAKMPEYGLMKQGKLALTDVGIFMTNREEKFMASWAEKIPLLKYPIKASSRAYTGFLNKLRADVFTQIVNGARAGGRELDDKLVKEIATFVNAASGRGPLGIAERGATALNGIFFSPRLMASRIHFLNPYNYIKADPMVRKEMFKSLFTVLGSGMTVLGLAKMAGAKVGDDWRSSDFGKIIVGNTRIDIWGGFQQYVRMLGQLTTGQYISSTTGKLTTLGEGYKPLTRFDIALRQVESKEAPFLSFLTDLLKQQDYAGKPIKITNEIAQRFIPMVLGDIYDLAKTSPELLPASLLGVFGVGLQTYTPTLKTDLGGLESSLPTSGGLPGIKGKLPGLPGL